MVVAGDSSAVAQQQGSTQHDFQQAGALSPHALISEAREASVSSFGHEHLTTSPAEFLGKLTSGLKHRLSKAASKGSQNRQTFKLV